MPLLLRRYSYSASPWRLAWRDAAGTVTEMRQAGMWWRRKREGLPVLITLQALELDWSPRARERWRTGTER